MTKSRRNRSRATSKSQRGQRQHPGGHLGDRPPIQPQRWRQAVARISLPVPRHRRVQGDYQRPIAGVLGPVNQLLCAGPTAEEVQLEPGRAGGGSGHLGDGVPGHRAQCGDGAGCPRCADSGDVARRVHHSGEPHRTEQKGHRDRGAQHARGQIRGHARDGPHPRQELHLLEGLDVGPEGGLRTRATLDVVPHRSGYPAPGQTPGVGDGPDTGGRPPLP